MLYALTIFFRTYFHLPQVIQDRPILDLLRETESGIHPVPLSRFTRSWFPYLLWITTKVLSLFMIQMRPQRCLRNAFSMYQALRAAGYQARFILGVFKNDGNLKGHSWVELEGKPLEHQKSIKQVTIMLTYP